MIFPFPYSNLYNLNLDWMIKTMKEMQEIVEPLSRVVNSVNGMTGDVQITKQFLLQILESMVSKFNGRAGDVTLTAADVNSTMIDITWTSDPGDVIEDIAQNVRDQLYAIGKRVLIFVNNQGVPDQIYFLTLVGDVVTPQIYSPTAALAGVASFNGQTGAVTATGSDLDTANNDDTPISESIGDLQTAVSHQSQQILNLGPYNGLDSESTIAALSAAQGKALKGLIDALLVTATGAITIPSGHVAELNTVSKTVNTVFVQYRVNGWQIPVMQNVIVGNIPEGYRPSATKQIGVILFDASGYPVGSTYGQIQYTGDIVILGNETLQGESFLIDASYAIN